VKRRVVMALALVASAAPAGAQTIFLSRTAFFVSAEHLSGDDPRFVWDAHFNGSVDLVDYGAGRVTFDADYEVVLGEELRPFDTNQGNYILAGSASRRLGAYEIAGVFHHESRHMADRPKRDPVDWNMVGMRVQREFAAGGGHRLDARIEARGVVQKSFVDYRWELAGRLRHQSPLAARLELVLGVGVQVLGVDGSAGRGTQVGVRSEGAVRFDGRAAAAELFVAAERRVDPWPLTHSTASWIAVGFRLLTR
jgi:hypothetical protein